VRRTRCWPRLPGSSTLIGLAGTPFELRVWSALRAVGAANDRSPIAIVVPCHRIIGAGGSLTGFGGGIERKKFLLRLEQGRELKLT
jgi:methylated-DNA-[protein]-cysteine S-methyltransferase